MKKVFEFAKNNLFHIIAFLIFSLFYCWYHTKTWVSSDHVTMLPFARDFLAGNFLLKGWVAGSNNFFFTETLFYLPGLALGISGYTLIGVISALMMAVIVVAAGALFLKDKGILYVLAYYSVVGLVGVSVSHVLINPNSHNGLYALLMLEFWLIFKYIDTKSGAERFLPTYIGVGVLVLYSDTVAMMGLIAPVLCLSAYLFLQKFKDRDIREKAMFLLGSTLAIYILEKAFARLIRALGGIETLGYPTKIVGMAEAKARLSQWFELIKTIWVYAPWGSTILDHLYHVAIVLIMLIFAVSVFYYAVRILMLKIGHKELLCWLIVVINLGGCIFTNADIHVRYCVLSFVFGVTLTLLFIAEIASGISEIRAAKSVAVVLALFFICVVSVVRIRAIVQMQPYAFLAQTKEAADFILDNDLGTGYGQFWCGPIMAGMEDYEYNVMPVYTCGDGFMRYSNLINRDWYEEKDIHYTVTFQNDDENDDVGVKNEEIVGFLGNPDWIKDINNYRIMYWSRDISECLVQ